LPTSTCNKLVLSLMLACHTFQVVESHTHAQQREHAQELVSGRNTIAIPSSNQAHKTLLESKPNSSTTDQWKLHSLSTTTSSHTPQECMSPTQLLELPVVTPSNSLVMVMMMLQALTTGNAPTHGDPHGERMDSSESKLKMSVESMIRPPLASQY